MKSHNQEVDVNYRRQISAVGRHVPEPTPEERQERRIRKLIVDRYRRLKFMSYLVRYPIDHQRFKILFAMERRGPGEIFTSFLLKKKSLYIAWPSFRNAVNRMTTGNVSAVQRKRN